MTTNTKQNDYIWVDTPEPHAVRRREILKKYPQIKELFGHEPISKYITLFWIITQVSFAYYLRNASWKWVLLVAYVYGGVAGHALYLAMHEISHNLFFASTWHNRLFGLFTNLFTIFPHFSMFERYHQDHHRYQGVDGLDVDIPSHFEGKVFTGFFGKLVWLSIQPVFYIVRPLLAVPKVPRLWDITCWIVIAAFDICIYLAFGMKFVCYLFLSGFFGSGIHPVSAHFISEHYVFHPNQETYSYYGPLNLVCFNVGYHNEHHDFPRIPWTRIPKVREIAREYYDNLAYYESWPMVLWNYITDAEMGPYSRVKRKMAKKKD